MKTAGAAEKTAGLSLRFPFAWRSAVATPDDVAAILRILKTASALLDKWGFAPGSLVEQIPFTPH